MTKTTRQQREAMKRIYLRTIDESSDPAERAMTYREFRRTVEPGFGCLMVKFANMWLGIEPDGYTHS